MGILPTNGELILTLLLFHSHIENVKMSLKVDSTKLWNTAEEVVVMELYDLSTLKG